jgi:hypothetical protein
MHSVVEDLVRSFTPEMVKWNSCLENNITLDLTKISVML